MIQEDHIEDEHPERHGTLKRLHLSRAAADADLDRARWSAVDGQEDYPSPDVNRTKTRTFNAKEFVPAFRMESAEAYSERIAFLSSPGWTQFAVDSFRSMFDAVDKNLEIEGSITTDEEEMIRKNIDATGTDVDMFASQLFREALVTNRTTVPTDRLPDQMPHAFILCREFVLNWVDGKDGLDFITWQSPSIQADGIHRVAKNRIIIYTKEELAIAEKDEDQDKYKVTQEVPNAFGVVPVCDLFLHKGMPLVLSIAKLEHNFMNLKSEMRKIMRDQAGLNILEVDHRTDLSKLTSTSLVQAKGGQDFVQTRWVAYPSGSMQSQFEMWDREVEMFQTMNRLRSQKTMAESGVSKRLDFLNADAVLNAISDQVQVTIEKTVRNLGLWLGKEWSATYNISRDFDIDDINSDLDALMKILTSSFGSTFEAAQKLKFAKKYGELGEEQLKQVENELSQPVAPIESIFDTGDDEE